MRELWKTTPIGVIARGIMEWDGDEASLKGLADKIADDFLYDISADQPVLVVQGVAQEHLACTEPDYEAAAKEVGMIVRGVLASGEPSLKHDSIDTKLEGHWAGRIVSAALGEQ